MRRMSVPSQRINLLRQSADASTDIAWGFKSFIALIIIGVSVLVLFYASTLWTISGLKEEQKIASANLQERQQQLAVLTSKIPPAKGDPFVKAELQRLQLSQRKLQRIIRLIDRQSKTSEMGFANYFKGLSRRSLDGVWLHDIHVSADGDLSLKGKTFEAALVPRLLQNLIEEPVFAGRSFERVRFERDEKKPGSPLVFELESQVPKGDADAG